MPLKVRWTFEELAYVFPDFIPEVARSCSCEEYISRARDSSGYTTTVRMPVCPLLPSPLQYAAFKGWLQEGVLAGRFRREVLQQVSPWWWWCAGGRGAGVGGAAAAW